MAWINGRASSETRASGARHVAPLPKQNASIAKPLGRGACATRRARARSAWRAAARGACNRRAFRIRCAAQAPLTGSTMRSAEASSVDRRDVRGVDQAVSQSAGATLSRSARIGSHITRPCSGIGHDQRVLVRREHHLRRRQRDDALRPTSPSAATVCTRPWPAGVSGDTSDGGLQHAHVAAAEVGDVGELRVLGRDDDRDRQLADGA